VKYDVDFVKADSSGQAAKVGNQGWLWRGAVVEDASRERIQTDASAQCRAPRIRMRGWRMYTVSSVHSCGGYAMSTGDSLITAVNLLIFLIEISRIVRLKYLY
jgi:hypothetical protein